MRKNLLSLAGALLLSSVALLNSATAQTVTYISPMKTSYSDALCGSSDLPNPDGWKNGAVWAAPNSSVFVNFEAAASNSTATGQWTKARVIVRRMSSTSDPLTLVASQPIAVAALFDATNNGGKNGVNDRYFVNLNTIPGGLIAGRYSIECQADIPTGTYNTASTRVSWNYSTSALSGGVTGGTNCVAGSSFAPYYQTGTTAIPQFAPTPGSWYAIACNTDSKIPNVAIKACGEGGGNPQLEYLTVGDAGVYRTMVIVGSGTNSVFFDMARFQPGNPTLPASLNGVKAPVSCPSTTMITSYEKGYCVGDVSKQLLIGAETNVWKTKRCASANVSGNRLFYRIYKSGSAAPAFTSFIIPFKDDCTDPANNAGPGGKTFPAGGSCGVHNCYVDQRWQTAGGTPTVNILPALTAANSGDWIVDLYTETDITNCAGVNSTVREPATGNYATSFSIKNPDITNRPCSSSPLFTALTSFEAKLSGRVVDLKWSTASEINSEKFNIQRSTDGLNFETIGTLKGAGTSNALNFYAFKDEMLNFGFNQYFYRLESVEIDGKLDYSPVRVVELREAKFDVQLMPNPSNGATTLNFSNVYTKNNIDIAVYNVLGANILTQTINGNDNLKTFDLDMTGFAKGMYQVRVKSGNELTTKKLIIE